MKHTIKLGNWSDDPCFYVSIIDGTRKALVAGPFITHEDALAAVDAARKVGVELDPKSWFYGWGTAKAPNGHHEGMLNKHLAAEHPAINQGKWETVTTMTPYEFLEESTKQLQAELPGVTFGYIGNLESLGDDRMWILFLPHPGRVGTHHDHVALGTTSELGKVDWPKVVAAARRLYALSPRTSLNADTPHSYTPVNPLQWDCTTCLCGQEQFSVIHRNR